MCNRTHQNTYEIRDRERGRDRGLDRVTRRETETYRVSIKLQLLVFQTTNYWDFSNTCRIFIELLLPCSVSDFKGYFFFWIGLFS